VDPLLTRGNEINDPNCLDIVAMFDINGNPTTVEADNATRVVRRCSLAARLRAIYGSVSNLDAFTGMMAERHVTGSELGELQLAMWKDQFGAARDGDRFFYLNDPLQSFIRQNFGIDSRKTLAQVIALNTDVPLSALPANVFRLPGSPNVGAGLAAGSTSRTGASATSAPGFEATVASSLTRHGPQNGAAKASTDQAPATVPARVPARPLGRRRRTGKFTVD
jgi:hypothetical protein